MKKELTCINCPNGCSLEVEYAGGKIISVKGAECKKGKEYAENEIFHPVRIVTTTVRINCAAIPLLPVRTSDPVPKKLYQAIVREAAGIKVEAPVKCGDVIVKDILGSGADLIASRSLERCEGKTF